MVDMKAYLDVKLRHSPPSVQRFVTAAREDHVYWRGDNIEFFKQVYEETFRMRSMGPVKYRAEAITKLKALVRAIA